jgi:glutathione S-transferase
MLTIIGRRTSGNVMKPLWAADEMGLAYEQVDLGGPFGGNDDPEYREKNPMGLVPTLDDDGFIMWESNAITRYLCEKHGQGTLYPDNPQSCATANTWMDWQLTTVATFMFPIFWGLVRTKQADRDMDKINAAIQDGIKFWAMLDNHLKDRDFIAGDRLTMGDIPVGPQAFRWYELVNDRPATPHMDAWYQRLCDRPAYQKNCMNPLV